jgi:hypothetical protein
MYLTVELKRKKNAFRVPFDTMEQESEWVGRKPEEVVWTHYPS